MPADRPLSGRVALVTGAGRGIGRATALRLASLGAAVICVARSRDEIEACATEAGPAAAAIPCDITAPNAAQTLVETAQARFGRLDILVLSSGAFHSGTITETDSAAFGKLFTVNVGAPLELIRTALPMLRVSKGQIAVVNSTIIRAANTAGRGLYAATQTALKSLTDTLRDEINQDGIRVISIMPGTTATPRQEAIYETSGKPWRPELLLQPEDVAAALCGSLLLPKTAEATDIFVRPMQKF
ncbi:SDR family oxidoreductase [Acetobacter fallax]|nr:SDR family NAD(P)-dependent oxidoreductase [Acetobacter fallax]